MGIYMYPIIIVREPKEIRYQKEIELEDKLLTLAKLRKHISEGEKFSIESVPDRQYFDKIMLYVHCKRYETPEEVKVRIEKEELYMKHYKEFQKNKTK